MTEPEAVPDVLSKHATDRNKKVKNTAHFTPEMKEKVKFLQTLSNQEGIEKPVDDQK